MNCLLDNAEGNAYLTDKTSSTNRRQADLAALLVFTHARRNSPRFWRPMSDPGRAIRR